MTFCGRGPTSAVRMVSAALSRVSSQASGVKKAECGVMIRRPSHHGPRAVGAQQLGNGLDRRLYGRTSSPTPARCPRFRRSASASTSTIGPCAVFTTTPPFMRSSMARETRGDRLNLLPCWRLVTDNAPEWPRGKYKALGWNGQGGLGRTGGQA